MTLARTLYTGVVFLPTFALHFVVEFLGENIGKTVKRDLKIAYSLTFLFLILVWTNSQFITGIYDYPWGFYPRGGYVHVLHTIFVLATALYAIILLKHGLKDIKRKFGKTNRYYETKYLFIGLIFVICGSSDFLHNWGINFFPIGCVFVALFVTLTTYAIFKHNLLGITVVIQKGLLYSLLISIMASLYFTAVYLTGTLVGDITKAHSTPVILFILALITLLFKPLEQKIQKIIDVRLFKNSREMIERENLLLRQEIQKQARMKAVATLAVGMAHEIKNPLTSIRTFAEYLPAKYDDPEFRKKFQRIVVDEVDRVNNIIKQLLDFSKPAELDIKPHPLIPILDETLNLLNSNLLKQGVVLTKRYEASPVLSVDKNQLKQAFLNLFLNSIQAMPDGGELTVEVQGDGGGAFTVSVVDTGDGIPEEHVPHLFDPFFTTKEDGTGLGLAIVHGIITKHGGKIKIKSQMGKGTTVSVVLRSRT